MIGGLLSSDTRQSRLWKILEKERSLSREQWREAQRKARREARHLSEILLSDISLPRERLLQAMSAVFGLPVVNLREKVISPYVLNLIPKEIAEQHSVVVFKKIRDVIHVATTVPENTQTITFVKRKTGFQPEVFLTLPEDIEHALRRYQSELTAEFAKIVEAGLRDTASEDSAEELAQRVPIIQMVNAVIERALARRASDVHFEPGADQLTIRFRVDGLLSRVVDLPIELLPPLVTRLKLLANLKIDEHRLPQDGRFNVVFRDRDVAVRVATIPTLHGTKVVLRLLDARDKQFNLRSLGLNAQHHAQAKTDIARPHGLILVTGPTGSGKTTTLYTLLKMLNKETVNICTIEDPIEYGLPGVNQTQVNPIAGLTFANGLRSLLRQDPNVIMVGEIRDRDTAEIAMNAAMTGHLVLSTLHTNDAFVAPQRLVEMGVQPFLAASVTNLVIGQRLVRKNCRFCAATVKLTPKLTAEYAGAIDLPAVTAKLRRLGLLTEEPTTISVSKGCDKCGQTGFQGRIGIYEMLPVDERMHEQIVADPSATAIRRAASNTLTMFEDGVLKVLQKYTTFDEVLRVIA